MITLKLPDAELNGDLAIPDDPAGMVVFAHGSGSSRHSPRNRAVAEGLNAAGIGTLLLDLLTEQEDQVDRVTAALRFDIELLTMRLIGTVDALAEGLESAPHTAGLRIGLFGASTGAAAALVAAAARPDRVGAVVSRGGRPDLAGPRLAEVQVPTLLIVGGQDTEVLGLNRQAQAQLRGPNRLDVVPGATHLFEEPGALERVAELARDWFAEYLRR
jgi:dienelactone hydrolase